LFVLPATFVYSAFRISRKVTTSIYRWGEGLSSRDWCFVGLLASPSRGTNLIT